MDYKLLGEICDVVSGGTPSRRNAAFWNNGTIPWIKIGNIKSKYVSEADEFITQAGLDGSSAKMLSKGTILYTIFATLGEVGILDIDASTNQAIAGITIKDSNAIMTDYLYYFLLSKKKHVNDIGRGVAQNNINMSILRGFQVPLLTIAEQRNIVRLLDKIESIINARKAELEKLDTLIKARFVEMFGDPIWNTQKRPTTDFVNVVMMQRGFDLPTHNRQQDGNIPVFGANGILDYHNVAKVHGGGVITGRSGTIGSVYYTNGDYWPLNTSLFSVNTHGNNIIYLAYLLMIYDLSRFTEGTGVPTLNRNKFHHQPIINVSLEEQNEFAAFVSQVEKTKLAMQKSLNEAQLLFDSLMQEYFG